MVMITSKGLHYVRHGTNIVLTLKKTETVIFPSGGDMGERFCPNCAKPCQEEDEVCSNCGHVLSGGTSVLPHEIPSYEQIVERVCPGCFTPYQVGDEMCGHCGLVFPSPSLILSSGTILHARYEIERLIHTGGMGYVYLARDRNLFDRSCVVKQVRELVQSEDHRKKLEEEALRMSKLSHPRIAMIFDHFVENNCYFIVVEQIRGMTLNEVFKENHGDLSEAEVVGWATSICEVMIYLHKEGVVHRDISPDNIMLNDEGDVKFIDFGTLRELRYVAAGGTAGIGKYGYAPPEQWQGNPEPRSDIFALGATLYYLLTGFLPLSESYQTRQIPSEGDLNPQFPPIRTRNPAISHSLEVVLQKALELDMNSRFSSAEEMREALMRLKRVKFKRKRRSSAIQPRAYTYRKWLIIGMGILALGMIGTGIFLIWLALST